MAPLLRLFLRVVLVSSLLLNAGLVVASGNSPSKESNGAAINASLTTHSTLKKISEKSSECSLYTGSLCNDYLKGRLVRIQSNASQHALEKRMRVWLNTAYLSRTVSDRCWPHAKLLVCHHLFPSCGPSKPFCQDDCRLLEALFCRKEFLLARSIAAVKHHVPDCYLLPKRKPGTKSCTTLASLRTSSVPSTSTRSTSSGRTVNVTLHKRGHLRCWFHVGQIRSKDDISVVWSRRRGKAISPSRKRFKSKVTQSGPHRLGVVLLITRTLKRDSGVYTCNVKIGKENLSCSVGLVVMPGNSKGGKRRRLKHLVGTGEDHAAGRRTSPVSSNSTRTDSNPRFGECRSYRGKVCAGVFKKYSSSSLFFEYNHSPQYLVERQLMSEVKTIEAHQRISKSCKDLGLAVLCFHMFQACGANVSSGPVPRLCKRDCLGFHDDYCKNEISGRGMGLLDLAPDCQSLPDHDPNCVPMTKQADASAAIRPSSPLDAVTNSSSSSSQGQTDEVAEDTANQQDVLLHYVMPAVGGVLLVAMVIIALALYRRSSSQRRRNHAIKTVLECSSGHRSNNNNSSKAKCVKLQENDVVYGEKIGDSDHCSLWFASIRERRKRKRSFIVEKLLQESPGNCASWDEQWKGMAAFRQLQHPNLLTPAFGSAPKLSPSFLVYDITRLSDLKMELRQVCQPKLTLPLNRFILSACAQVSSAVAYLHAQHVVHGDVSMHCCYGNMSTGVVRLARSGFGSYLHNSDYVMHKARGPIPARWMAPETLQGDAPTPASDAWSFGVFVWEMYSFGENPYASCTTPEALDSIMRHDLLFRPVNCPEKIFAFVQKCWHVSPEQRPSFKMIEDIFLDWCPDPQNMERHKRSVLS